MSGVYLTALPNIANNPSQYIWIDQMGAAIVVIAVIACISYMMTGGK